MERTSLDVQAEKQALGIVLLQPRAWSQASELLEVAHFSRECHRQTWQILAKMAAKGQTWDTLVPFLDEVERAGKLVLCGGQDYLVNLMDAVPSVEGLPYLATQLEAARQRRELLRIAGDLADPVDPEEARQRAEQELRELGAREQRSWLDGEALADKALIALAGRREDNRNGVAAGWRSSLPTLARLTGGYRPGQVTMIAARPGMGKSALLIQDCVKLAMDGHVVAFFSLEMPWDVLAQRAIAQLASVDATAIRDGHLTEVQFRDATDACTTIGRLPFYVDDRPASPSQVRARLQGLISRVGRVDVVAVDYAQLLQRDAGTRYLTRNEEVGSGAKTLQALAKEEGIAVLLAVQVGRAAEAGPNKRPTLADLRESGDLEAVADAVMCLYRPEYYDKQDHPGCIEVIVRKARHGQPDTIYGRWEGEFQRVTEIDRRH